MPSTLTKAPEVPFPDYAVDVAEFGAALLLVGRRGKFHATEAAVRARCKPAKEDGDA